MIRKFRDGSKRRRSARNRRRSEFVDKRRVLRMESLEDRRLLAVLTNGNGDGFLTVQVNEQGAFGNSPNLAVNLTNRPANNDVDDAIYNPVGPRLPAGTTYESGLAIRPISPNTQAVFLTAGTIAGTGNNVNGFFKTDAPQTNTEVNSRFFWPNAIARPSDEANVPTGALLQFDLKQTLTPEIFQGQQVGTSLIQEYQVTNVSGADLGFELIRYFDGDLYALPGGGGTPLADGGGRRVFDPTRSIDGVWQTDQALNSPNRDETFIEVRSSANGVPRGNRWEVGLAGNALPVKPIGPLLQSIIAATPLTDTVTAGTDSEPNNALDVGQDADVAVALRNEFIVLQADDTLVFVSTTVFGNPPQFNPPPPPDLGGTIEGIKFLDLNVDGVRDPGEPGLPNFTVYIDGNDNGIFDPGELSDVTDATGAYSIDVPLTVDPLVNNSPSIPPIVREVQQPNFNQTAPLSGFYSVDILTDGFVSSDNDFGNVADPATISGVKWNDLNGDGSQDAGEPGLSNVIIFLDADDDGVLDGGEAFTTTDANGNYSFTIVEPANYVVAEVVPADFDQTFPSGDGRHRLTVRAGDVIPNINFGNRLKRGSITGTKWNDLNGDGVRQSDEFGVANIFIYLDINNDQKLSVGEPATLTNLEGKYQFTDLAPGFYYVRENISPGQLQTVPGGNGGHFVEVFPGLETPFVDFANQANFDFGDAPSTYPTARHAIVPDFRLGARIDGESASLSNATATGDDNTGGGFAAAVPFAVGDLPSALATGDVSGDGIADLIVANTVSDDVSVLFGNSDGTFNAAFELPVDQNPVSVVLVDIDNNGTLDIATANLDSGSISLLINTGGGVFDPAVSIPAGNRPSAIIAADIDGDADIDFAVANRDANTVSVIDQLPGLMFESPEAFDVQDGPIDLIVQDFNNDGRPDLATANQRFNSVSVLRSGGGGVFFTAVNYVVGTGPGSLVAVDLDGDSDIDLAVANEGSQDVTVLFNNGVGIFPTTNTTAVGGGPVSITAADLDGDADPDLAVAVSTANAVTVLINDGAGAFPATVAYPTGNSPVGVLATRLNNDAVADLITTNLSDDTASTLLFAGNDEDGVAFVSGDFIPGSSASVDVTASADGGVLNAWIDYNRNGNWNDPGEQVVRNTALAAGVNRLFFTVPAGAATGGTFARFRFSSQSNVGPAGDAGDGEVEDYLVTVAPGGGGGGPRTAYTNPVNRFDVDGNGVIELIDVLAVINDLRVNGIRALPMPPPAGTPLPPFIDVSGDGNMTLNDILLVVNALFSQMAGAPLPPPGPRPPAAEGEAIDSLSAAAFNEATNAPTGAVLSSSASSSANASPVENTPATENVDAALGAADLLASRSVGRAVHTVARYGSSRSNSKSHHDLEDSLSLFADDVSENWFD